MSSSGGQAVFQFDVPQQGSVWTGTIAAVVPNVPGYNFTNLLNVRQQTLFGQAQWTMFRNGVPELTWLGFTVLTDFQAYGLEQITIQANGLVPSTNYQLSWTGHNQSDYEAPILYPSFSTTTTLSTGAVSSQIQSGQTGTVNSGSTSTLLAATPGTQWQLWDLTLDMAGGTDGTPAAATPASATFTATLPNAGLVILRGNLVWEGTTGAVCKAFSQQMRGFQLPVGDGLQLSVSGVPAGFIARGVLQGTFSTI